MLDISQRKDNTFFFSLDWSKTQLVTVKGWTIQTSTQIVKRLKWKRDNNIQLLSNRWFCWWFIWQIPVGCTVVCRGGLKCSLVKSDQSLAWQPQSLNLKIDVYYCGHLEINLTDLVCAVIGSEPFMSIIIIVAVICLAGPPLPLRFV